MNELANFRIEPIRSRRLLDSARGQPCEIRIPGICNHDPETTVSCHVHDDSFGMARKADDTSTFHGCSACHAFLDTGAWLGRFTEAEMLRMILRAVLRTIRARVKLGAIRIDPDRSKPARERQTKPRLPKEQRSPVPKGRKLQGRPDILSGKPLRTRNNLRARNVSTK